MPNIIGGSKGMRYFQMPDSFVRSGDLRELGGPAVKIYVFLFFQINCTGQVELELTNTDICDYTGIKDHSTIQKARGELEAQRRIKARKGPSGGFIYALLDDTGIVFNPAKGRRPVRYRIPREKPSERSAPNTNAGTGDSSRARHRSEAPQTRRFCYAHGHETEHWTRNGRPVCQECHPDPERLREPASARKSSRQNETAAPWRPPNAREVGF